MQQQESKERACSQARKPGVGLAEAEARCRAHKSNRQKFGGTGREDPRRASWSSQNLPVLTPAAYHTEQQAICTVQL